MSKGLLIGSGFYASEIEHNEKERFFKLWLNNTWQTSKNIVITDNSELGLFTGSVRIIRCKRNLGHACKNPPNPAGVISGSSMCWILPALVAYADGCDFVNKEQDCLAFGNWLPEIARGGLAFGRNKVMPCEQSLFWIRHDHILPVIHSYMARPESDFECVPEEKFVRIAKQLTEQGRDCRFHDVPGGRDRPLPMRGTFYGQRFSPEELDELRKENLI